MLRFVCCSLRVSIHAPRAGRDFFVLVFESFFVVSIHAPRAGRDLKRQHLKLPISFQSTRPARGATTAMQSTIVGSNVSIHAPARGAT